MFINKELTHITRDKIDQFIDKLGHFLYEEAEI